MKGNFFLHFQNDRKKNRVAPQRPVELYQKILYLQHWSSIGREGKRAGQHSNKQSSKPASTQIC